MTIKYLFFQLAEKKKVRTSYNLIAYFYRIRFVLSQKFTRHILPFVVCVMYLPSVVLKRPASF